MPTSLFSDIVFGPVRSRRLGLSLGVNLLPVDGKLCSFDCLYCECGRTSGAAKMRLNGREEVREQLCAKLHGMIASGELPDTITFAGNGEPTLHPDFEAIVDDTLALRDELCSDAKVSVLSNATRIGRESVRRALLRVDNNILKLASAFDATVRLLDRPAGDYSVAEVVEQMKLFDGRLIIQTMFLHGRTVDNTTEREVAAWLELLREIRPARVMIYTIDRPTAERYLHKASLPELLSIAARVERSGVACEVAG